VKKLIITISTVLFSLYHAQIDRGTVYVSGQLNYSRQENKNGLNYNEQTLQIIPTTGVFIAPNLALGAGLGYKYGKRDYVQTYSYDSFSVFIDYTGKTNTIVIAPFVRKYWNLSDNLYIFGQLEVPMEFGKLNQEADVLNVSEMYGIYDQQKLSVERKYTSIGVNVKPGFDYFLNKRWSIEATLGEFGYHDMKYKDIDDDNEKKYTFGLNLSSVTFGVKYIFAK
jgi:outer membrane immunogenic protein